MITTWSSVHYGSVNKLELWTQMGKIRILLGKQMDIQQLNALIAMYVLGEKTLSPTTVTNSHRNLCWGTVRAGVDKRGVGHVH